MAPTYGGAPKCTTCTKSVYFQEQQLGPGLKVYHKGCLRCLGCKKNLAAASDLVDHAGDPYCKSCYQKNWGPKGYGGGGVLQGNYDSTLPNGATVAIPKPVAPVLVPLTATPGPVTDDLGRDLCRRCTKVVYAAEHVMAAGQKWHKSCLRCAECSGALSLGMLTERDGLPYCNKCYDKSFGTGAQGLMLR